MGKKWVDYLFLIIVFSSFIFSLISGSTKVFILLLIASSVVYVILKLGPQYYWPLFNLYNPFSKKGKFLASYKMAKDVLSNIKKKKLSPILEDAYIKFIERQIERMRQVDADSSLIKEIINELYDIGKTEDLSSQKDTPLTSEIRKIDTEKKELGAILKKETKVSFRFILFCLFIIFLVIIAFVLLYFALKFKIQ